MKAEQKKDHFYGNTYIFQVNQMAFLEHSVDAHLELLA